MRVIAIVAGALLLSTAHGISQVTDYRAPGLRMGYMVEGYFGDSYTERTRLDPPFFPGEPIAFRVEIGNSGPSATTLVVADTDLQRLFRVESLQGPPLPPGFSGERVLAPGRRRFEGEREVTIPVTFSGPLEFWPGGEFEQRLERETKLEVREGLKWVMNLPTDLAPGMYRMEVSLNGTQDGQPINSSAVIRFEVRGLSDENRPEFIRREALRRLERDDLVAAREAVDALLRVHPNSALGYAILETIADREGKFEEAAAQRGRMEALLKNGRDELLLKYSKGRSGN